MPGFGEGRGLWILRHEFICHQNTYYYLHIVGYCTSSGSAINFEEKNVSNCLMKTNDNNIEEI